MFGLWCNLAFFFIFINILQGAGTAIGELPPYFMARAARLSGAEPDDEEYEEFEEMLEHAQTAQVGMAILYLNPKHSRYFLPEWQNKRQPCVYLLTLIAVSVKRDMA